MGPASRRRRQSSDIARSSSSRIDSVSASTTMGLCVIPHLQPLRLVSSMGIHGSFSRATTLDNVTGFDADTKDACCDVTVTATVTGLDSPGSGLARTARLARAVFRFALLTGPPGVLLNSYSPRTARPMTAKRSWPGDGSVRPTRLHSLSLWQPGCSFP